MNVLGLVAPYVTSPYAVWGVVAGLLIWAIVSAFRLGAGTRRVRRALDGARLRIEAEPDASAFAGRYEATSAALTSDPLVGAARHDFSNSLVLPAQAGGLVHSTVRPDAWFDDGLLRRAGLDLRYHAALPNLLVGAGLLFTFLGLAVALNSAGSIVTAGADPGARSEGLRQLLDTASFKFTTSLFGLLFSIAYAIWRKGRLRRFDVALSRFLAAVEKRMPLLTPATLQRQANTLLERQLAQTEQFSHTLAVAIGTEIDRAMDARLGDHIGPLRTAIEALAERLGGGQDEAMQRMLDAFLQKLQGGTGDQMQQVAGTLAGLGAQLASVQSGMSEAASRMAEAADGMARRMGEGAESALARVTDQVGGLTDALRAMAEQTRDAGNEAGETLARRMAEAAAAFESSAQNVATALARAGATMQSRMDEQASATDARLSAQLETMVAELRALAEASRGTGEAALAAMGERIGQAAAGFEATAARVAEAMEQGALATGTQLGKGAEDAVRRIAAATEGMRTGMEVMLAELRSSFAHAGEQLRGSGVEGAAAFRGALGGAGGELAASIVAAAEALRGAGNDASAALRSGAEAAGAGVERIGREANGLAAAASSLLGRTETLQRVIESTSDPLGSAAEGLRETAASAQAAARPLAEVARLAATALEQLGGAAQRLDAAQAAATRFSDQLGQAAQRFEGIDRALAGTLTQLQAGLSGFTEQVRTFVTGMDSDLAKAANHIGAMVKELDETLEDALKRMRAN